MKLDTKLDIKINYNEIMKKVGGDDLGTFASHEWKRIITPYTPHKTGNLERNVEYRPWEFIYLSPYSFYVYAGSLFVDPKYKVGGFTKDGITYFSRPGVKKINSGKPLNYSKEHNPKATKEWDKAAIRDKQDKKLARAMQGWVDRNI